MSKTVTGFKKSLNLSDATALVIGSMIGSGIFIVSSEMSRTLGSPGWLLIAWFISGLMTIFAATSFGELASLYPKAGGQYVYLREAWGPLTGFLYGWTLFLVIQTGTIAAVAMAFAKFSGFLIPWVSESDVWIKIWTFEFSPVHLVAIVSVVFLSWLNTRGIKTGKKIQNVFTYSKAVFLIAFILVALVFAKNQLAMDANFSNFWVASSIQNGQIVPLTGFALIIALGTSMVGSLFAADAWNNVGFASEEVVNPKKNIAKSMIIGTFIVCTIYIIINYVYLTVLPLKGSPTANSVMGHGIQFATNERLGTAVMVNVFDEYAAVLMAIFIVVSTFGCNNGLILSGARVYYAMAVDKLFFKKAGELNSKGVPALSLVIQCVWTCLLCLSGTYNDLLKYVIFAVLIFYILTIAGLFKIRKQKPEGKHAGVFKIFIIPVVYILLATFIVGVLLVYESKTTLPGLFIVLIGVPVYWLWRKINAAKAKRTTIRH
jgi:basic amino acid/polyamine antiporter, APA family